MVSKDWKNKIRFVSNKPEEKDSAIELISKALEKDRLFLDREGLSGTLPEFSVDLYITIFDEEADFVVDMAPRSEEGHDFKFRVSKKSTTIERDSFSIGEVEPEDKLD